MTIGIMKFKKQRGQKNEGKNKQSLREMCDTTKLTRRREEREKETNKTLVND